MVRWGSYDRTDARLECGTPLQPIPVQRWRCAEHGSFSFLPPFLARYLRYLVQVVTAVLGELVDGTGRLETLVEVIGPSLDTARRWIWQLVGPRQERWLMQHCPEACTAPPLTASTPTNRSLILTAARNYVRRLNLDPNFFPLPLQRAHLADLYRYSI